MKFLRQQGNFKKRLVKKWVKPKGRHSKLREKRRGLHKMPSIGFKKSEKDRKKVVLVHNFKELEQFKKNDKITISSSIGAKKKILLFEACLKKGIIITNHKKIKEKINEFKEELKKKKEKPKPKPKPVAKKKVVKKVVKKTSAKKAPIKKATTKKVVKRGAKK
jgi:large subunit ribosomal protein L32e